MKFLLPLLAAGIILARLSSATPVFGFDSNGGALTGIPGGTVGWGFTISDSSEYVVVSETGFCAAGATVSDLPCTNPSGTYTDFSFNIPVVGPSPDSPSVTQGFDLASQLGYGSFTIGSGVTSGTVLIGEIAVVYDLFTGDPSSDPNATQIGGDNFTSLPASISVSDAATVPEPGTLMATALTLCGIGLWRARRRFARLS